MRNRDEHVQLEHDFTNHAPVDEAVVEVFETLREFAKAFGHTIIDVCPDSAEREQALLSLRQALMWSVGAVACHQEELADLDIRTKALRARIQTLMDQE